MMVVGDAAVIMIGVGGRAFPEILAQLFCFAQHALVGDKDNYGKSRIFYEDPGARINGRYLLIDAQKMMRDDETEVELH